METFSPNKELESARKAPKEERKEKLEEFKEKLAFQKEGIAEMQAELIAEIRKNPDITTQEFEDKASKYTQKFGLDQFQHKTAVLTFQEYQSSQCHA